MALQKPSLRSAADQLTCIASYFCSALQRHQQQSHGRLPLAWAAASPSARLVAEQHNAWVVLPFESTALAGSPQTQGSDEDNAFGAALANATTPLFALHTALGLDAADTGGSGGPSTRPAAAAVTVDASKTKESSNSIISPTPLSAKLMSWISETTESLADVNHAASPIEEQKPASFGTSRAKPPAQKSTRPSTGVRGPQVEDPLEAARGCGVHVGGLTTVLVSGVHLYEKSLQCDPNNDSKKGKQEKKINPSGKLLFPSTTCCGGSVSSLLSVPPNAAVYDTIANHVRNQGDQHHGHHHITDKTNLRKSSLLKEGAKLHEDDGGAEDETAHDPQTAASVYTVQQVNKLHAQVRAGHLDDVYTTVWYRHTFVDAEEVMSNVLCGVSQWWLQRTVHLQELPTTKFALYQKQHRSSPRGEATEEPEILPAPPLYIKFTADIGVNLWWPRRLLSVVHHRFAQHPWCGVSLLRWVVFLWLFIVVLVESMVHGVPDVSEQRMSAQHDTVDLLASFHKIGEVYGGSNQLAALDVSHTGVRGVHLLACALGKVVGAFNYASQKPSNIRLPKNADVFGALDMAGCIQLHHYQDEMHLLAEQLDSFHVCTAQQAQKLPGQIHSSPLTLVDLLMTLSLREEKTPTARSATGLALALLSHHGCLTWLSGAGCSLDNAALHELGTYALLVNAVSSISQLNIPATVTANVTPTSCSIVAMDLTSALSLEDLNPVAYLSHAEQLLVPFTYVTDAGVARLDGHTYPQDLRNFFELCTSETISFLAEPLQAVVKSVMRELEHFTVSSTFPSSPSCGDRGELSTSSHSESQHSHYAVEALHQRFRSHLYQIDFTYCSCLSSVNGLVHQQRLELLNLSQTRINKAGLFITAEKPRAAAGVASAPPLRLFIAEMCEHLSDLGGLAHISTLECVIVRSGSLGDDGLRSLCTKDMRNLQLIDLSYCDRLHHIGCLANLPALETLILDSTDVTPAEVRQLRQSRSLETLSVRFCTEFAFIGKDRKELENVVGKFPNLKYYVYEDLIGDGKLRKKTN